MSDGSKIPIDISLHRRYKKTEQSGIVSLSTPGKPEGAGHGFKNTP